MNSNEQTNAAGEVNAPRSMDWILALILVLVSLVLYGQMSAHEFVNLDDQIYITENPTVLKGLSADGMSWAFQSMHGSNWHPITWLSHMLDVSLFGTDAGAHHRTNAILHAICSALAFFLLRGLLRAGNGKAAFSPRAIGWIAFLGTAFFAWHPLRVESVAWVSERKDLLAALFWFLSVLSYLRYLRAPSAKRYLPIAICLTLSLMSKPMAVTLPFLLLLLDVWPLQRSLSKKVLLEKLPLLAIVIASSIITVIAQREGGAMDALAELDFSARLAGAFNAQAIYLGQMFWPGELGFFYPHPGILQIDDYQAWTGAAWRGVAVFALISCACILLRKRLPWLLLGWFWFLGMLVPVIGLLQVGGQAHADRYTYLPSIGIGLGLCASVGFLVRNSQVSKRVSSAVAMLFLLWLMPQTVAQVATWKNSVTASTQATLAAEDNYVAHNNLGKALEDRGDFVGAFDEYITAVRLRPDHPPLQLNVVHALLGQQRWKASEKALRNILENTPGYHAAYSDLGVLLAKLKRHTEAVPYLRVAWGNTQEELKKRAGAGEALAWILASGEPRSLRDGPLAVEIMQACMQGEPTWLQWNTLAAGLAQSGLFVEAVEAQKKCNLIAPNGALPDLKRRLDAYENGRTVN